MAQLNTATLNDMTANVNIIWRKTLDNLPLVVRNSGLFVVDVWPMGTGDTRQYSEIDTQNFAKYKAEGSSAQKAKVQQGYTKTVSPVQIGLDIDVTWQMRQRNKYRDVYTRLVSMAQYCPNRLELDASHRIGFGTATSMTNQDGNTVDLTVGDGLALFSTVHTLRGSASTYRNRLANNPQFSKGSLEGMETLIVTDSPNQFGEKMTVKYDVIFSSDDPNTCNTIKQHLQSTADISAPNNGVLNVYMGKYRHIVMPYLATDANGLPDSTKAKMWGIAATEASSAYMAIEQENTLTAPSPNSNGEDFSTENWTYKSRMSYALCIVSGAWIKVSTGDAAA